MRKFKSISTVFFNLHKNNFDSSITSVYNKSNIYNSYVISKYYSCTDKKNNQMKYGSLILTYKNNSDIYKIYENHYFLIDQLTHYRLDIFKYNNQSFYDGNNINLLHSIDIKVDENTDIDFWYNLPKNIQKELNNINNILED